MHLVETVRDQFALAPSRELRAGAPIVGRFVADGPAGWLFQERESRRTLAWLQCYDGDSWQSLAVTGDEAWAFGPLAEGPGRRLAAWDRWARTVASSRATFWGRDELEVGGAALWLRRRHLALQPYFVLGDDAGWLARVIPRGSGYVYDSLAFEWLRPPASALLTLFAGYSLIIDRATALPMVGLC